MYVYHIYVGVSRGNYILIICNSANKWRRFFLKLVQKKLEHGYLSHEKDISGTHKQNFCSIVQIINHVHTSNNKKSINNLQKKFDLWVTGPAGGRSARLGALGAAAAGWAAISGRILGAGVRQGSRQRQPTWRRGCTDQSDAGARCGDTKSWCAEAGAGAQLSQPSESDSRVAHLLIDLRPG
jgi:hypothetical protein